MIEQESPLSSRAPNVEAPRVDIYESERAWLMVFDVPGVHQEGLELTLTQAKLSVRAKRASESRVGARALLYQRDVPVPPELGPSSVDATLKQGQLRVRLLKTPPPPVPVLVAELLYDED